MATFSFGGRRVDDSDAEALADGITKSGGNISGSIVLGNSYGVTGGTVTGDVIAGDEDESPFAEGGWHE